MITNNLPSKIFLATTTNDGLMSAEDKVKVDKIDRMEYDISQKANKDDKIKSSQLDTSSNENKIQPNNLSEEVLEMMAGTTPVSATVADGSLVTEKYADGSVLFKKRTPVGCEAILSSTEYCNFNTSGDTYVNLEIPANYTIIYGDSIKEFTNVPMTIKLPKGEVSNITYNAKDGIETYTGAVKEHDFLLGVFDGQSVTKFNGSYLVDGSIWFNNESIAGSSLKDYSIDSDKLALSEGHILSDPSKKYINVNFKDSFVEITNDVTFDIGYKYNFTLDAGTECFIPQNTNDSKYLYIYYNLGYGELTTSWSSSDRGEELFEEDTKLILLGVISDEVNPVGINSEYITINSNSNAELNTAVYANILDTNVITIDYKDGRIKANANITTIINDTSIKLANKDNNIKLTENDIVDIIDNRTIYSLVSVKRETYLEDRTLKLVKLEDVDKCGIEVIRITDINGYSINYNQSAINMIDKAGVNVKHNYLLNEGVLYPFGTDVLIDISTKTSEGDFIATVTLRAESILDKSSNVVYKCSETSSDNILMKPNGVYSVIMNTRNGVVSLYEYDSIVSDMKNSLHLGFVESIADTGAFKAQGNILNNVTVNGIRPSNYVSYDGPDPDKTFDWKNNRIILPDDLYLIKGVDYSIMCQNISSTKYVDNDNILYELALPNKTIQSENSLDINSSLSGDFETMISGKFKGNNSALFKNINLHIINPSDIANKTPNILCIGDEMVDLNLPGYLKYYLNQFGVDASFLGTVSNTNSSNGYGLKNIPSEKGEGRSGWRLTDFMCHTKRNDETNYYKSNNPFMNTETNVFDFNTYMTANKYEAVDVVVVSLGLNDILGYHTEASIEDIQNLSIYQNLEVMPLYYKEMISSIHAFNPDIKIIIDSVMTMGIDDTFNKNSLLWAETLFYELKDMPNVFTIGSYIGQGLFTGADKATIDKYTVSSDINNTKIGNTVSNKNINGTVRSNKALYIASTILNVLK